MSGGNRRAARKSERITVDVPTGLVFLEVTNNIRLLLLGKWGEAARIPTNRHFPFHLDSLRRLPIALSRITRLQVERDFGTKANAYYRVGGRKFR